MPPNKNALARYKALDRCFRNPSKRYFIEDLMAACDQVLLEFDQASKGISRRQVFEDINFMSSEAGWAVPLEKMRQGKRVFYRYTDLAFSIDQMPLNEMEINQLQSAVDTLAHFSGMPQFEWINEWIPKLQQGLPSHQSSVTIVSFDHNPFLTGLEYLSVLYQAIVYKKVLQINYQPFDHDAAFVLTLHPYHLKQYNNRWFVYGFNPLPNKYDWSLALDRIKGIEEILLPYVSNDRIDWANYFEDLLGVSSPEGASAENITLLFFGKTGKYMESKPIHGSQRSAWLDADTLEVRLELIINYELERFLLSYADTMCIVTPQYLKQKLRDRLAAANTLNKT